jgi:hypothetical protein
LLPAPLPSFLSTSARLIEALVAQPTVEALDEAVLHRLAGRIIEEWRTNYNTNRPHSILKASWCAGQALMTIAGGILVID